MSPNTILILSHRNNLKNHMIHCQNHQRGCLQASRLEYIFIILDTHSNCFAIFGKFQKSRGMKTMFYCFKNKTNSYAFFKTNVCKYQIFQLNWNKDKITQGWSHWNVAQNSKLLDEGVQNLLLNGSFQSLLRDSMEYLNWIFQGDFFI